MVFMYKTAVGINISMIIYDIWRLADQKVCRPVPPVGGPHRGSPRPPINTFPLNSMIRRLDCSILRCYSSMLAAGLSLVLVAG